MPSFDNSPQDGAAEYCDKRVCFDSDSSLALDYCARYQVSVRTFVCVCVGVCLSAITSSELHVRSSPNFYACYLWSWLGPPLAA